MDKADLMHIGLNFPASWRLDQNRPQSYMRFTSDEKDRKRRKRLRKNLENLVKLQARPLYRLGVFILAARHTTTTKILQQEGCSSTEEEEEEWL